MSDLLSIGLSGLSAYRSALSAVGDNVSNAETPSYARRSVRLGEAASGGSGTIGEGEGIAFSGVKASAVLRSWDDFKAADARLSASVAGRANTRQQWLTAVGAGIVGHVRWIDVAHRARAENRAAAQAGGAEAAGKRPKRPVRAGVTDVRDADRLAFTDEQLRDLFGRHALGLWRRQQRAGV